MRTRSLSSSSRTLTLASSSAAGTTTLNSRLRPSDSVSVTCIAHTLLCLNVSLHARRAGRVGLYWRSPAAVFEHDLIRKPVPTFRDHALAALGMVRAEGLEPPRLSSREPKSRASTNSATPAKGSLKDDPGAAIWQGLARNGLTHRGPPGQAATACLSGGGLYHGKTARQH